MQRQKTHSVPVQYQEYIITVSKTNRPGGKPTQPGAFTSCNSKASVEWWSTSADRVCLEEWNVA